MTTPYTQSERQQVSDFATRGELTRVLERLTGFDSIPTRALFECSPKKACAYPGVGLQSPM